MIKTKSENIAANFLLGKLTEEENIKIEKDFFGKANNFENILIAENDLIDAYVRGNLSAEDKNRFESRLLINPKQRQRVEFTKTLVKYASNLPVETTPYSSLKSKWSLIFSQFFSAKPLLAGSFAFAALIFFVGVFWIATNNNLPGFPENNELASIQTPTTDEIEQPLSDESFEDQKPTNEANAASETKKDKSPAAKRSPETRGNQSSTNSRTKQPSKPQTIISTIILPLGLTRDSGTNNSFEIPAKANFVNFQLKFEEGDFTSFFAVIETVEGRQIWSGKVSKSVKDKNEKTVTVTVPAQLLKKEDYIITLKGLTTDSTYESIGDYSFNINRP